MKENKQKLGDSLYDEELDIFGEHKTREQVRAEEKVRRKEEREALKQEIARRRQQAKEEKIPTRRKDILVVGAVVVGIVLLCVLALANSFRKDKESKEWLINEARGHYVDAAAHPDMSGEQPLPALSEAYFTNNGHLCLELKISNGTDKVISIEALDVRVYDFTTDRMIAGGKAQLKEPIVIPLAGVESYTYYIAPEHVLIDETESLPELVYCEMDFDTATVVVQE